MKKKTKKIFFRLLFVALVVIIFLAYNYYPCFLMNFSSLPESIQNIPGKKEVVLLYGTGLCLSCVSGRYLYGLRERRDILYVVPPEFEETDIENLLDVFVLKGKVIKGDNRVSTLIKRINRCKGLKDGTANFHIYVNRNGKPDSIKLF